MPFVGWVDHHATNIMLCHGLKYLLVGHMVGFVLDHYLKKGELVQCATMWPMIAMHAT